MAQDAQYVHTSFVKAVEPVVVERAIGAEVYGADGCAYLDCFTSIAVVNAGYVPPRIAETAKAQMDCLIHAAFYIYYVPTVTDRAEVLVKLNRECAIESILQKCHVKALQLPTFLQAFPGSDYPEKDHINQRFGVLGHALRKLPYRRYRRC